MKLKTDKNIKSLRGNWNFSGKVPNNFLEHVKKSIPFYEETHELILDYAEYFCKQNSICYEIGSATGELTKKLAKRFKDKQTKIIGIDNEKSMINFAKKNTTNSIKNLSYLNKDIVKMNLKKSDLIISFYTIHFIEPKFRQEIFNKIYESLNWGGALILFEKVRAPDARFQDMSINLYNNFKYRKGFDHAEIYNKSESLKSVLEPYSSKANLDFLKRAGFKDFMTIFKFISFEGFLAIK